MAFSYQPLNLSGQGRIGTNWADGILNARNDKVERQQKQGMIDARGQAVEQARKPDGSIDWSRASQILLGAGDIQGAQITGSRAEQETDNQFRREEAQRSQSNADRAYSLQAQTAARAGQFNLSPGEARFGPDGKPIAVGVPKPTEYDDALAKNQAKADVELQSEIKANAEGAKGFKDKVTRAETLIREIGDAGFGPLQGSSLGRWGDSVSPLTAGREAKRQQLEGVLRELELDIAKMKLKGQGQVTEAERKIARETLPQFTNQSAQTALDILSGISRDANAALARAGMGPSPAQDDGWQDLGNGVRIREKR